MCAVCFWTYEKYSNPYSHTRIVAFWHISNIPPRISWSQNCHNTPILYIEAICEVIAWKHFPNYWLFGRRNHFGRWIHLTKSETREFDIFFLVSNLPTIAHCIFIVFCNQHHFRYFPWRPAKHKYFTSRISSNHPCMTLLYGASVPGMESKACISNCIHIKAWGVITHTCPWPLKLSPW